MYLSSQQTNEDTPNSFMSRTMEISTSTSRPGPSQLFAAGVSGAAVGGAVVALLILAVLAAAGVTILIVVLVRRRSVHKSTILISEQNVPHFENPLYQGIIFSGTFFMFAILMNRCHNKGRKRRLTRRMLYDGSF